MFEDILQEKKTWENGYYYCPYIPLQITKTKIEARKRKLKVKWTLELQQELEEIFKIKNEYHEVIDV